MLIQCDNVPEFNFTLKWVDDGAYGSKNEDTGAWNGMLGEVLENVSATRHAPQFHTLLRAVCAES